MELYITQEGRTISGKPCYWLDSVDGTNERGEEIEDGDHFTPGFFGSEDEAKEWAEKHGHTIAPDD